MEFIEATAFTKHIYDYLGLQSFLLQFQKQARLSEALAVRVIYYFKRRDNEIWLLTMYSKSEVENIPAHVLRQIAKEIENV